MEVSVLGSGYVGLAQPDHAAEVCRWMCGNDFDASHVGYEKVASELSGVIRVEDIKGASDPSSYIIGRDEEGREA
ncbi:hypothetical protein ACYZUC_02240 [Pseudomonas sp. GT1P32]